MKTETTTANSKETVLSPPSDDAISILLADHRAVKGLFASFEEATTVEVKQALAKKICTELSIHAQLEEEIFYPAVQLVLKDKEVVPEALIEHKTLKSLVEEVEDAKAEGEVFNAKIKVMREYTEHHVKEEEKDMFPEVRKSSINLSKLGAQMVKRRAELLAQYHRSSK